ncbi:MAG TPA: FAD-binding protein [Conexibacter sp.]|jgi:glycolate oxidase FAD binding subunit
MSVAAGEIDAVRDAFHAAVLGGRRVLPAGGRTKPGLSTPPADDVATLDTSGLRGIVEYDPRELTMTALAGTPVAEVRDALAEHGQHLPFDPPLVAAGATLGGVVASGAAGPCALRHGGVRDFLIGVRFLDGTGTLVGGGGRVVKNAAGFDLPKLMVGSIGRLGVLVQLAFKVFPSPPRRTTVVIERDDLASALGTIARLGRGPIAVEAIELLPPTRATPASPSGPARLFIRADCSPETVAARVADVAGATPTEQLFGDEERALWDDASELRWAPEGHHLLRVPLTPAAVIPLDAALRGAAIAEGPAVAGGSDPSTLGTERRAAEPVVRYTLGANAAWVAWPGDQPLDRLDATLRELGLAAAHFSAPPAAAGQSTRPLLGAVPAHAFAQRIRAALDPNGRFPEE